MRFADIQGNEALIAALRGMVDADRIPHAIMLHEDDGGGAMPIVQAFLQYLYCKKRSDGDSCGECPSCSKISKLIHPDVYYIFPVNTGRASDSLAQWRELVRTNPCFNERELGEALEIEGKTSMIKVEEARGILDTLSLSALERGYRSVVIYLPEKLNREAANRLLKAVEEPPALTQFIFITHAPDNVLQTISSRCLRLRVEPPHDRILSVGQGEDTELLESLLGAILSSDLLQTLDIGETLAGLPSRERAKSFCAYAAERLRLVFLLQQNMQSLVKVPQEEMTLLGRWASAFPKTFVRKAEEAFSRARMLIDRNVNLKILFSDLVCRLYRAAGAKL